MQDHTDNKNEILLRFNIKIVNAAGSQRMFNSRSERIQSWYSADAIIASSVPFKYDDVSLPSNPRGSKSPVSTEESNEKKIQQAKCDYQRSDSSVQSVTNIC